MVNYSEVAELEIRNPEYYNNPKMKSYWLGRKLKCTYCFKPIDFEKEITVKIKNQGIVCLKCGYKIYSRRKKEYEKGLSKTNVELGKFEPYKKELIALSLED